MLLLSKVYHSFERAVAAARRRFANKSVEESAMWDEPPPEEASLTERLRSLPVLKDDLYLRMQALNLGVVDGFLRDAERQLRLQYFETERTPVPQAVYVSALCQLWVLGLYELLRTWRQRAREVLRFADEVCALVAAQRNVRILAERERVKGASSYPSEIEAPAWRSFERAVTEEDYVSLIELSLDSAERLFRRIEALRVWLAKHEVPKDYGSYAMAPGYGRIDYETGSIQWQVALGGNWVDVVSRREIADACIEQLTLRPEVILPRSIQAMLQPLPNDVYGAKRVTVTLAEGTEYEDVFVLWNREITAVGTYPTMPFDAPDVVDVRLQDGGADGYA